ncbi:MAG: DUF4935 domain-containing protein [Nitrospinae bacterium]|nr:DUF4935 domain-containing protein [Nitrospinota bacterium]
MLAPLKEQKEHIFVTKQVVNEVKRQKVQVAAAFFKEKLKGLNEPNFAFPDHLFGKPESVVTEIRKKGKQILESTKTLNDELKELAGDILGKISQSNDEVSEALAEIFAKAVTHDENQLRLARARKELGQAPGKRSGPLGDELNWEQILSQLKEKGKLWIISRDGDYLTKYRGKMFLNAQLYQDLVSLGLSTMPEVFCFDNIPDGIKHFAVTTHVAAKELPSPEETEKIKKEQESLPPLGWLDTNFRDQVASSLTSAAWEDYLVTLMTNPTVSVLVPPPPETPEES